MATKFSNRDRLRRKLQALPLVIVEEARRGLAAAADKVVKSQKALAPVKSGELRDSIGWKWAGKTVLTSAKGGGVATGRMSVQIKISAGAFHAAFVEFGTSPHDNKGRFAGTANPGTAAHGFFYPGYRLEKKAGKARVRRAMKKGAQSIARKS